MFNDREGPLYCARCSAKFHIFAGDPALIDQLCTACWHELEMEEDADHEPSPPNVNDLATYERDSEFWEQRYTTVESLVDAMDAVTQ